VAWSRPATGISYASPLLYNGKVYVAEMIRRSISCYNSATGEPVFEGVRVPEAARFWTSPWAVAGKVYFMDEEGKTHVLDSADEFRVLATLNLDDTFRATPAVLDNGYIFRGVDWMYCIK
jgi:outer membrane protein assembly factor BamB